MSMHTDLTRPLPWSEFANVRGAATAEEAMKAGGLDWEVKVCSLYAAHGKNKLPIKHRKAIMRTDTEVVLGVVSDKYKPVQNAEAFQFADNLVDSSDAKFTDVGEGRGGQVVYLVMQLPEEIKVAGEDPHNMYVILHNGHDGSKALGAYVSMVRQACTNQNTMITKGAKFAWKMNHTASLAGKLQEARDTLRLSFEYAEQYEKMATDLLGVSLTDDQCNRFLESLLPKKPQTEQVAERIMSLYKDSPTNGYTGTGWGMFNAVTEYYEHGRETRSRAAVMYNVLHGQGATLRNTAAKLLLAAPR